MHKLLLALTTLAAAAAARVYTGFNYGAFWSVQSNVKRYADFYHGFQLAKNLTDTPVPFDSARLFTCISAGTKDDPTDAFQAAIDTKTSLLLGMWVSPGVTGQPDQYQVANELSALAKGFEQHGQKLADLVIGLSVGSEDIYRFNSGQAGASVDNIVLTMKDVRSKISASSFAKYMEGKPIGHTDTAQFSILPGADFIGVNAYPYWNGLSIEEAAASFLSELNDTQHRAGNTSVWITEVGWPIGGSQIKQAVAGADNYQRYWDEVGCQVFGKHNTFWFELLQDTTPDQPDWGLLNTKTYQPRIRDLSCINKGSLPPSPMNHSSGMLPKTLSQPQSTPLTPAYLPGSISSLAVSAPEKTTVPVSQTIRTIHITVTTTTTVALSSLAQSANSTSHKPTNLQITASPSLLISQTGDVDRSSTGLTVCITMTDLMGNGVFIPVAINAGDASTCAPPPRFTGSPLTIIAEAASSPSISPPFSPPPPPPPPPSPGFTDLPHATPTALKGPTCVTSSSTFYEAGLEDGKTCFGSPTPSCPLQPARILTQGRSFPEVSASA